LLIIEKQKPQSKTTTLLGIGEREEGYIEEASLHGKLISSPGKLCQALYLPTLAHRSLSTPKRKYIYSNECIFGDMKRMKRRKGGGMGRSMPAWRKRGRE